MSRLIDRFENRNEQTGLVEALEEEKGNDEVVEGLKEDKDRLSEIDAIFSECVARATKLASHKLAGTEPTQATMILEIAKIYLEEVRKGAERG